MSLITIPQVSYNTPFGNVNKSVWFKPDTNTPGNFDVELNIIPNTTISTTIRIANYFQGKIIYSEEFPPNASQTPINRKITITHNPTLLSQNYVLLNLSV